MPGNYVFDLTLFYVVDARDERAHDACDAFFRNAKNLGQCLKKY